MNSHRLLQASPDQRPGVAQRAVGRWARRLLAGGVGLRWGNVFAAACLMVSAFGVPAQDVFVTRDAAGKPVFSDKGQPGAQPVTLPPLNVVPPIAVPKATAPGRQGRETLPATVSEVAAYRWLRIAFPENEGSVVANTAVFEVRLTVEPPLRLGDGHAIVVSVNGRPVGQRFTATEFMIPPEFWGDSLPPDNQRFQLDAAIVDRDGGVLKRAAPVSFTMRHVFGVQQRSPHSLPPVYVVSPVRPPKAWQHPLPPPEAERNKLPFAGMERLPPAKGRESETSPKR